MTDFQAVVIGAGLGAYSLARELNDAYGVKPTILTADDPLPTRDSAILTRHFVPQAGDEEALVSALIDLALRLRAERPDLPIMLLGSSEWHSYVLARHRLELAEYYRMSLAPLATIERLGDAGEFAALARAVGMNVPAWHIIDFSDAASPTWVPDSYEDLPFPVVAAPADSLRGQELAVRDAGKYCCLNDANELRELVDALVQAGFRDRLLLQEVIPGGDLAGYCVTAYVDSHGSMTMGAAAHVLLSEHAPSTLGNPCSMITVDAPDLLELTERFLSAVDYRGFATFSVRVDPQTGDVYFLRVHPSIGVNSYYCVGAGMNPMKVLIEDVLLAKKRKPMQANRSSLYNLVPVRLLQRYLTTDTARRQVRLLLRRKAVFNPLDNPKDGSPKRRAYRLARELTQVRNFRRYYPTPTDSGF